MKKTVLFFGAALFAAAVFGGNDITLSAAPESQQDSILASCNGEPVLLSDVLKESASAEATVYASSSGEAAKKAILELRRKVVNQIVDRRLVKADFLARKMNLPEQFVENMLDDFAAANGCRTRSELEAKIRAEGLTMEQFREEARNRIIYQAMVATNARQRVYLSPRRVYEYYKENKARYGTPEKIALSLIRVGKDRAERESVLQSLASAVKEDKLGFGELAKLYSDGPAASAGGSLGLLERGQLRKEFASAMPEIKIGSVVGPLDLDDGVYYLLVTEQIPAAERAYREVAPAIREELEKAAYQKAYDEYVGRLRSRAEVQFFF